MRSTSLSKADLDVFRNFKADIQAATLEFIGTVNTFAMAQSFHADRGMVLRS